MVKADKEVDLGDEFSDAEDGTKNKLDFANEEDDLTTVQQHGTSNASRHSVNGTENPYHSDFPKKPDPSAGQPRPPETLPATYSPFTSARLEACTVISPPE